MTIEVRIDSRGQRVRLHPPNAPGADVYPFLDGVSDWYEQACVDQVPGFEQGETPTATVVVNNAGGLADAVLDYPLNAIATIVRDGEDVLTGIVHRYTGGQKPELTIEVGGLSDNVPLRSSEAIDAYRESKPLAWVYGDLTHSPQACAQLSDTEFHFADHAATVTAVQIDGQDTQAFAFDVTADATGHTYTRITLAAPLPTGAVLTACGTGKRRALNGALMQNPADIIEDIMAGCGFAISAPMAASLAQLRADCAAEGLTIAGRVSFAVTLRETLNVIARCIGALWSSESFVLYPPAAAMTALPAGMQPVLEGAVVTGMVADARSSYDVLDLRFDDQSYAAQHRQAIKLKVAPSYGEGAAARIVLAGWLRTVASATAVGKRMLRRAAGKVWLLTIEASAVSPAVRKGDVVPIASPMLPSGWWPVTILAAERVNGRHKFTAELVIPNAVAQFTVVSRTVAGGVTQLAAVEASITGNTATFTVTDSTGKLMIGAQCSLDGASPRRTDAQGRVSFDGVSAGLHTLYVSAAGYQPFELTVTL